MTWNPRLWRTAVRVEAAYARRRAPSAAEQLPGYAWEDVAAALRRRDRAAVRGWRHAQAHETDRARRDLDDLLSSLRALRTRLENRPAPRLPVAAELYAELAATEAEFGSVVAEDFELVVTTDPIVLEGIYLGPFEMRLDLGRLEQPEPFRVTAVDPHPAQSCRETIHPHVHAERICLGEGKAAVAAALAEGRLCDLFQLIHRVLQTYGEGSPYVALDRWHGVPCADCDDAVDDEESYSCHDCGRVVCSGCARSCECGRTACHDCAISCRGCEATTCAECLTACEECGEDFCQSCLEEGLCHACHEAAEEERAAAELETDEAEPVDDVDAVPWPEVHADRLVKTAVLARPRHHRNRRLRNLGRR